jgi:hypothetical protein
LARTQSPSSGIIGPNVIAICSWIHATVGGDAIDPSHQHEVIARTIGAESSTVEIDVTSRNFTVWLVNSKFNEGARAGRETEVAAIEPIV